MFDDFIFMKAKNVDRQQKPVVFTTANYDEFIFDISYSESETETDSVPEI